MAPKEMNKLRRLGGPGGCQGNPSDRVAIRRNITTHFIGSPPRDDSRLRQ